MLVISKPLTEKAFDSARLCGEHWVLQSSGPMRFKKVNYLYIMFALHCLSALDLLSNVWK